MMRTGMELTALGRVVSGSSVSATVVPTISMPMKAKSAIWKPPRKPVNPLGKKPPWLHRFETAAAVPSSSIVPMATIPKPTMTRAMIAMILTSANQNSVSPKALTVIALRAKSSRVVAVMGIHAGRLGHQKCV